MEFGGNFVYVGEEETQEIYEDFEDMITEETPVSSGRDGDVQVYHFTSYYYYYI
jgi:hypothetical protein